MKPLGILLIVLAGLALVHSLALGLTTYDLTETRGQSALVTGLGLTITLLFCGRAALHKARKAKAEAEG